MPCRIDPHQGKPSASLATSLVCYWYKSHLHRWQVNGKLGDTLWRFLHQFFCGFSSCLRLLQVCNSFHTSSQSDPRSRMLWFPWCTSEWPSLPDFRHSFCGNRVLLKSPLRSLQDFNRYLPETSHYLEHRIRFLNCRNYTCNVHFS